MQVIVFEDGVGVSVLVPILDSGLTIEEIAQKDVPENTPYWIIDDSELPDRADRGRWIIVDGSVVIDCDAPTPPALLRQIDARRLRLALLQLNLLDTVEAALAQLCRAAQIEWEYATTITEDNALVIAIKDQLQLDTEAIITLALSLP